MLIQGWFVVVALGWQMSMNIKVLRCVVGDVYCVLTR